MKSRGISTVIATILMLMITLALSGAAYLYISGALTSKTASAFEIIDEINGNVTIRNSGTETITSMKATLNGDPVSIAVVPHTLGLVGYWSINENAGTKVRDSSEIGNTGITRKREVGSNAITECSDPPPSGCPQWVDGRFAKALKFHKDPNVDNYVEVRYRPHLPIVSMTVEAWVNGDTGSFSRIVSQYTDFYLNTHNFLVDLRNPSLAREASWSDCGGIDRDIWNHLVAIFDDSQDKIKIYKNGVLCDEENAPGQINGWDLSVVYVGSAAADHWSTFDGTIDEVAIYNRALSEDEIKSRYSGLVLPGQPATVKPLISLEKGRHTLRLCTSSMCNTAILTVM